MIKGIAASSGIAIAKVFKLEHPVLDIKKHTAVAEEELKQLDVAVIKTKEDIKGIQKRAVGRLSDEELAIFDAHLMVLDDPEFVGQIIETIKNENVNAEYATKVIADNFIQIFEGMDNDYFKERAADVRDVTYRLSTHIMGKSVADLSSIDEEVIIVANDLTPSDTAQLDRKYTLGFATEVGGRTSHSAIMARSLEIPAIVGIPKVLSLCETGDVVILDALEGELFINPEEAKIKEYKKKATDYAEYKESLKALKDVESVTTDGHHVEIVGNIGTPNDAINVLENGGEGVGLYRTEFLYMDASSLPSEEDQYEAYKKVLEKMGEKPVVVRTLDIGGDKKLTYLPLPEEMNPFLGYRAIRLCLDRPDIFNTQLRALLRASAFGNLCIMFPMIATINEFRQAKAMVIENEKALLSEGIKVGKYQLGMMVEIPATAVLADQFAKEVDFFSIGTNDLIQYSMAADRMSEKVSYLYQPYNPSLLRLIKMTIDGAHKEGKWVGMCGEMAGEELAVPILLGLGLDEFSMSASSMLAARKMVRALSYKDMKELASRVIDCSTQEEVLELVTNAIK
jgi:phosphotransferase system enzyme I (PtsI)